MPETVGGEADWMYGRRGNCARMAHCHHVLATLERRSTGEAIEGAFKSVVAA